METRICVIKDNIEEMIEEAATVLRQGGLVAFPTETVYGLGGNALDEEVAKKIYAAKGRPSDNPLIVHIADLKELDFLVKETPDSAKHLMQHFWPGPLTLIFEKSKIIPFSTTGGLDTVAIRIPNDLTALALIKAAGIPIAAPSANASGRPSPTTAQHVEEDLSGRIDMILDHGPVNLGLESTIVDVTTDPPSILRPGCITYEMLKEVLGDVEMDPALLKPMEEGIRPKAPGMKYRHYAPKAKLRIIEGKQKAVIAEVNRRVALKLGQGIGVGIIGTDETKDSYPKGEFMSLGSRVDESGIAHNLYRVLRYFDSIDVDYIYSESFSTDQLGQAIMNRLSKAAGYHIEKV